MKKTTIVIASLLLSSFSSFAGINSYQCTESNTKPWGCAYKTETVRANPAGGDNYELRCINPGEVVCQFSDGTCPLVVEDAIGEIKANIYDMSIMTGNIVTPWGNYSWSATDPDNFEYTVNYNF